MTFKNWIVKACMVIAAAAPAACGSSSPAAPSGLPGTHTSAATGARINGSVMRAGLTVAVVGTDVSAVADGAGNFTLTNVPAGDVQLKFSGAGTDASLTLNGVNGGEDIRLVVNVNGSSASVQNLTRGDRKVEIEGLVASGTCASFVVNGTTITTNATTVFQRGTCASVIAGAKVEVKGTAQPDGSVQATHVKLDDDDNGEFEVEGTISAFTGCSSFTVNGIVITTDASTKFQHGTCSSVNTGVKVDVKGTRTGGVYLATRVEFEQKNANRVELEGLVTAGGCGSFTLRGVVVTTDATTQFKHGVCSGITTGVKLHVRGTRVGTGVLASLVIFQDVDDADDDDDEDDDEEEDAEEDEEEDDDDGSGGGRGRR